MNLIAFKNGLILFSPNIYWRNGTTDVFQMEAWVTPKGLILPLTAIAVSARETLTDPTYCPTDKVNNLEIGMLLTPDGRLYTMTYVNDPSGDSKLSKTMMGCKSYDRIALSPDRYCTFSAMVAIDLVDEPIKALDIVDRVRNIVTVGYQQWKLEDLVNWTKEQVALKFPEEKKDES
jgi:hypothetical protein